MCLLLRRLLEEEEDPSASRVQQLIPVLLKNEY